MSTEISNPMLVDRKARCSELQHIFLSVQRERVALTECIMRHAAEWDPADIETLIVRAVRVQRVVEKALSHPLVMLRYKLRNSGHGRSRGVRPPRDEPGLSSREGSL